MEKPNKITIDEVEYVRADGVHNLAAQDACDDEGREYVIVRSKDSGCHAGYIEDDWRLCGISDGATLYNSRRLWYWDGAATLSQLATTGPQRPGNCKFPAAIGEIVVYGVCEVIPCTTLAQEVIEGVSAWSE